MFDYETAANLCRGGSDKLREFASQARWTHDDRESCGGINCQLVEFEQEDEDEYQSDIQAAAGGLTQTACEG